MDAQVVAGWIGAGAAFVGTIVGAGVSVWATVLTQRHETKRAVEEKRDAAAKLIEERAHAAGANTLNELYALRRHILGGHPLDNEEHETWAQTGQEMADQAEMAAGLIPRGDEVRRDLGDALTLVVNSMMGPNRRDLTLRSRGSSSYLVNRAIDIVLAFQRGAPLPEPMPGMEILRRRREEYLLENPPERD